MKVYNFVNIYIYFHAFSVKLAQTKYVLSLQQKNVSDP